MTRALVIGGTRFIGRHLVEDLLAAGYDVTLFNRGNHPNPFAADDRVEHFQGDRTDEDAVATAARTVDPDSVFDCVAYHPPEVEVATRVFTDVDAYVYISSGGAYEEEVIPKREDETGLHECSAEQATADTPESYGPRKAEGDRIVERAAEGRGVRAMSVRPCIVYGPHDYTARLDYWIDRARRYKRVVVPGDGTNVWHRAYVEDVASAMRVVAENGIPGEAYNVGDRRLLTLAETVETAADALGTDVEVVGASERELAAAGLEPDDFVLWREYPHVLDTSRLAALGWQSTPVETAMERAVEDHLESDRTGREHGPDREAEARVIEAAMGG